MRSLFKDKNNQIDRVHIVGEAGEPPFTNGWINYDTEYGNAKFWIDPFRVVHLEGLVKNGTIGASIFTLPKGYRPISRLIIAIVTNSNTIGRLDIATDGTVIAQSGNNAWFSISGTTFRAA